MTQIIERTRQPVGFCLVLSAPSGAGKTTISQRLLEVDPNVERSISMTTRPQRPDEVNGSDYLFTTKAHFRRLIDQGEFLEWAEYHGNLYGTPRAPIERIIKNGQTALLVIDVQGGQSVKSIFPDAVLVFLMPPSMESLEYRLLQRGTETEDIINGRLAEAEHEMQFISQYTYRVINENGEQHQTVETIQSIITAERCRISRWEKK